MVYLFKNIIAYYYECIAGDLHVPAFFQVDFIPGSRPGSCVEVTNSGGPPPYENVTRVDVRPISLTGTVVDIDPVTIPSYPNRRIDVNYCPCPPVTRRWPNYSTYKFKVWVRTSCLIGLTSQHLTQPLPCTVSPTLHSSQSIQNWYRYTARCSPSLVLMARTETCQGMQGKVYG